jgi:hypothetical protein
LTTQRAAGSGYNLKTMTREKLRRLRKDVNHSDKFNYSSAARKYGCDRKTIKWWLKKWQIRQYKKKKSPLYTETQKEMVRRQCAWLYRNCRQNDFVIDDEKYFTLSHSTNDRYFSSPTKSKTLEEVSHKYKMKFEPKIMFWIVRKSGLAVNQNVYLEECIKKRLIPFINTYHSDNNYQFWSDKASAHYGSKVLGYLNEKNIKFVPKFRNPTNVPQCRPIEDFFGYLCGLVYEKGWRAQNIRQLKDRIKYCLKKVDKNVVKRSVESVRKKL